MMDGQPNDQKLFSDIEEERSKKVTTVKELKRTAKALGIKPAGLRKAEPIKAIQKTYENFDSFGTATDYCA